MTPSGYIVRKTFVEFFDEKADSMQDQEIRRAWTDERAGIEYKTYPKEATKQLAPKAASQLAPKTKPEKVWKENADAPKDASTLYQQKFPRKRPHLQKIPIPKENVDH